MVLWMWVWVKVYVWMVAVVWVWVNVVVWVWVSGRVGPGFTQYTLLRVCIRNEKGILNAVSSASRIPFHPLLHIYTTPLTTPRVF